MSIESNIPSCQVSHEELFQLKNMSGLRANFAVLLLKWFFEPSELEGKNIAGVRGKEQVNPVKVSQIKRIVSCFFLQLHAMSCQDGVNAERPWRSIFADQAAVREHNKN